MKITRKKLIALLIILLVFSVLIYWALTVDKPIKNELEELREQEFALSLPSSKERTETIAGCTWPERHDLDGAGCYIGVSNVYYEEGSERKTEQMITANLLKNGWQKKSTDLVYESRAAHLYGNNGSYTKQTTRGRFCAGITYRYFSNNDQSGPRSVGLYILGPSDLGCNRW